MEHRPVISSKRLYIGGIVIVIGFLSPLLIPLITATNWSIGLKSAISGLLALGIPEVFMIIGVAILGKEGYQFLKDKLFGFLKQFAPPDKVSISRYRIGLVMFILPLLLAWVFPIALHFFPSILHVLLWVFFCSDGILLASFAVLGGDFWDKLNGLFQYNTKITHESL